MSSRTTSMNTQLLVAGLVAAATISLVVYYASLTPATASSKKKEKKFDDDNKGDGNASEKGSATNNKKSTTSSSSTKDKSVKPTTESSRDATPKKSNVTDEKELHSKIEELDKKGKALFKNKKVRNIRSDFEQDIYSRGLAFVHLFI